MPRKVCCLFLFLFICSALPSLIHADNQTVFGPKSFEIGKWHAHASVHTFNVEDPGEGIVTVTKNTPDKPISGGFILFNTTLVPLHDFLVGVGGWKNGDIGEPGVCGPEIYGMIMENGEMWGFL